MSSIGKTRVHPSSSRDKSPNVRPRRNGVVQRNLHEPGYGKMLVDSDKREQLIATVAYYRAQQRGFMPGNELEDWLQAETEVDRFLLGGQQMNESSESMSSLRGSKKP